MPVNVLVASADLDVHELVADILEIIFKDITLDRVLDIEHAQEKLQSDAGGYDLILLDYHLGDMDGTQGIITLLNMYDSIKKHVVIIMDGTNTDPLDQFLEQIPTVSKPFSLDEFDHIVRNACR